MRSISTFDGSRFIQNYDMSHRFFFWLLTAVDLAIECRKTSNDQTSNYIGGGMLLMNPSSDLGIDALLTARETESCTGYLWHLKCCPPCAFETWKGGLRGIPRYNTPRCHVKLDTNVVLKPSVCGFTATVMINPRIA